jgi:hypothetical protein
MKRFIWLVPAIFFFCMTNAQAQQVPAWEISGGYSYLDANIHAKNDGSNGAHIHLNGGGLTVTENLNSWFGGRVEVSTYWGHETVPISGVLTNQTVSAQTATYGPVFTYRRSSRVTPYAHVQIGAIRGGAYYQDISAGAYKFALGPGAGLDFALNTKTILRVDAEYLMSRFLNQRQDNLVGTVGIVYHFGKR